MNFPAPLPIKNLHASMENLKLPWQDSTQIPVKKLKEKTSEIFQNRALQALELGASLEESGYNIYLCGGNSLGRTYFLTSWLKPAALRKAKPNDIIYAQNFENPDAPVYLNFPAGNGKKFKSALQNLIQNLQSELKKQLNSSQIASQRANILSQFHTQRTEIINKMKEAANAEGFKLQLEEDGNFALIPNTLLEKDGAPQVNEQIIKPQEAININDQKKDEKELSQTLIDLMREMNTAEDTLRKNEKTLEKRAMLQAFWPIFSAFKNNVLKLVNKEEYQTSINHYLSELEKDIIQNTDKFLELAAKNKFEPDKFDLEKTESDKFYSEKIDGEQTLVNHYDVNLFIDNSQLEGAPVIVENNPTAANLLGCMERESEMGALVTDLKLIRPGSLHKANGGYLILHADDIVRHPAGWDGLIRSLKAQAILMDDLPDYGEAPIRSKSLHPDPLPLNVKIILIGDNDTYETLLDNEPLFQKFFRIKAHLHEDAPRNKTTIKYYLSQIAQIISEANILPLDASALAWLVDLGSHLSEDQKKLSLKFPVLREYMLEASLKAQKIKAEFVTSEILEKTYSDRIRRANLIEDLYLEEYDRKLIKVNVTGSAIGQVNGLSLTMTGDYEFGLPHRISCITGVGHEGIIDLEHEAELGGKIHTKAMMILRSYLTRMFAQNKPLVLTSSLYFEQNYGEIEGDSASGAELVALLSALAKIPVRLDLAITGAVSHTGEILPVGGVTKKIEGFYKICKKRGLTGTQGVLIPASNIDHLMLSPEVISSVKNKQFAIYPIENIEDALLLLTGQNPGKQHKDGKFTKNSIFDLVDKQLEFLGCCAQKDFRKPKNPSK